MFNRKILDGVVLRVMKHLSTLCGKVQFEIFAPLGYCMAVVGSLLPMFHHNISVPPSRVKKSRRSLKMGLILCPETLVTKYQPVPYNIAEEE
jgi:hypothetical protein